MELDIYYFSSTESSASTPAVAEIWAGMNLALPNQPYDSVLHLGWWEWVAGDEIVQQTGVKDGGVVIFDTERSVALLVIAPGGVTRQNIAEKLQMLYGVELGEDGGYVNADGTPWGFGNGQANDHKCLFKQLPIIGTRLDFLCELEGFLWMALAGFSALKTAESATQGGKAGWGTVAAFSSFKTIEAFKP